MFPRTTSGAVCELSGVAIQPLYEAQALTQNVGLVYPEVTQLN